VNVTCSNLVLLTFTRQSLSHASSWVRWVWRLWDAARGVLVAYHESSVISERGNGGVVTSWHVSSENQEQEKAENASLRYSWVDWKDWRSHHIEFYLGVAICEIGFKQETIGCGKRTFEQWHDVNSYCRARQAADDNMAHAHYMLDI